MTKQIKVIAYMDHIDAWQRNGKPAEKQGRKATDLKGVDIGSTPAPQGGWTASCSLIDMLRINIDK